MSYQPIKKLVDVGNAILEVNKGIEVELKINNLHNTIITTEELSVDDLED